ncbi:MAG: competence protein ComEA [Pseudomonadales bacterium]|nr:competence protein ComEA [Pseudomonadales bacterium]RLU03779.1 MAG: helix-hairpin-helix domain-containing protein [Ketobacter sp.]
MRKVVLSAWLLILVILASSVVHAGQKPQYIIPLPININVSDALTLSRALVGVGPVKAAAIVAYREQHGPFTSLDALLQVKGIGPGTLHKNRGRMSVQ